jgi:S-adenosylmethionine hydrolase
MENPDMLRSKRIIPEFTLRSILFAMLVLAGCASAPPAPAPLPAPHPLVIMTDFGVKDGAVSAMKGVAYQVDPRLSVADLTHEIPPYNIWEGAYRLQQTYKYWPPGTVFVTVVDPGVGSERRSVALVANSGHVFVGPDNGLFTLIEAEQGLRSARVIDEGKQRLKGSEESNTFHGRDLYVYVGARLASGRLAVEDVGPVSDKPLVKLDYQKAEARDGALRGSIPVLDPNYGNVWTNIPKSAVVAGFPNGKAFDVKIFARGKKVYEARVPLVDTFAAVAKGKPLLYYNSLMNLALALNQADFAARHHVGSGPDWTIQLTPVIGK